MKRYKDKEQIKRRKYVTNQKHLKNVHFGELPNTKIIYQGKLSKYNAELLP